MLHNYAKFNFWSLLYYISHFQMNVYNTLQFIQLIMWEKSDKLRNKGHSVFLRQVHTTELFSGVDFSMSFI